MLDEDGETVLDVKLGDFGLSRTLKTNELAQSITGTPFYMSPELWYGKPYGRPADIWAVAGTLYEMCMLRRAFNGPFSARVV